MTMGGYWVCDACHSLNDPRYDACYKCRVKRGSARPVPIIPGATTGPAASEFFGSPLAGARKGEPSVASALLFGLAASVVLTWAWYVFETGIHLGQGRGAVAVGSVIALVVVLAGTLGGRRRVSFMLPVVSLLLTLGAVVIGEYLIISLAIATPAGVDLAGKVPIASPELVMTAAGDFFASDPLRPILWAAALAAAWLIPWGALVGARER